MTKEELLNKILEELGISHELTNIVPCERCHGLGEVSVGYYARTRYRCDLCNGSGEHLLERAICAEDCKACEVKKYIEKAYDLMTPKWQDKPDKEGFYWVTNNGRIDIAYKSKHSPCISFDLEDYECNTDCDFELIKEMKKAKFLYIEKPSND